MNIKEAKKLHNGDEVQSKNNGEIIKVLDVRMPYSHLLNDAKCKPFVTIKGTGSISGYREWFHDEVK